MSTSRSVHSTYALCSSTRLLSQLIRTLRALQGLLSPIRGSQRARCCAALVAALSVTVLFEWQIAAATQDPDRPQPPSDPPNLAPVSKAIPALRGPLRALITHSALTVEDQLASVSVWGDDGSIAVTIRSHSSTDVIEALESMGRRPANVAEGVVEVYLRPDEIVSVATHPSILSIELIDPPQTRVLSQGRMVHNASAWIGGGHSGAGVRVGIIDNFVGLRSLMGIELPNVIVGRCYLAIGAYTSNLADCERGSSHGTAVAESLMDIAPGVSLYIANPISKLDFINTISWMLSNGVRVINYSAARPWDGPGNGTSPQSDSPLVGVDMATSGGAVFVTAAGNEGQSTWFGAWNDSDGDGFHQFTGAIETNGVLLFAGEVVSLQLRWHDSWIAANTDLDLGLYDSALTLVAASTNVQDGALGRTPFEKIDYVVPVTGWYYFAISRFAGSPPAWLQVQTFSSQPIEFYTSGSIGNPAETANPGALAVGAAAWNLTTTIEPFSSVGPTPDGRIKPEVVGSDRADTFTYGPGAFLGTSQASPHVAGLAALVVGAFPSYTPQQVASYIKSFAQPRGSVPNNTWGFGFARLPDLCAPPFASPSTFDVGAGISTISISVTAGIGCSWNAMSNVPWLQIISGSSGLGNGTVVVTVAANPGPARVGTLTVAGVTVMVTQSAGIAAPSSPLNFSVSVVNNSVTFSWSPPQTGSAVTYVIEAGTGPGLANIVSLPVGGVTVFTTNAPNGTYYTRVRAVNTFGVSAPSNEVSFTVGPVAPGPPQNLRVTVTGATVAIAWDEPVAGGTPSSYLLEAGSASGLSNIAVLPVTSTSLLVPFVPDGTYFVRARATNTAGVSAPSAEISFTVGTPVVPPGAPSNLVASVSGNFVQLTWEAPTAGGIPTSYTLQAGSGPGLSNIVVFTLPPTTGFNVAGVPPGSYFVRVVASNAGGTSAASNEVIISVRR
jgi:hypothetical protein